MQACISFICGALETKIEGKKTLAKILRDPTQTFLLNQNLLVWTWLVRFFVLAR